MFEGIYFYCQIVSTIAFDRHFHWDMVLGKNEYLYVFVFLVIMQNLCPCLLHVLVSAGISNSLSGTFVISFIILHSIINISVFSSIL